jgi:predicted acyl esterase
MTTRPQSDDAQRDRPWRRPGGIRYAARRIKVVMRVPVTVTPTPPGSVVVDRDLAVATRDGTVLRVNVHRPPGE